MFLVLTHCTFHHNEVLVASNRFCSSLLCFLKLISCFRYGFHAWMKYSTAEPNCGIASSVLYPCLWLLFVIPKVELALFGASAHCLEGFELLCIISPKSSSLTFNTVYLDFI